MTLQHPVVLYIGSEDKVNDLHEAAYGMDWMIYHPAEVLEALGMYTFYYPDTIIIEDNTDAAHEAYMHLRSINVENIIILTDDPNEWHIPLDTVIRTLPLDLSAAELMHHIQSDSLIPQ